MTSRIKDEIKAFFETGDKPSQSQFGDFIDSYVDMAGPMGTLQAQVSAGSAGIMIAAAQTASIAPYSTVRDSLGVTVYTTALSTSVVNSLVATTAQANAGTDNSTLMNPVLVKNAIAALTTAGASTLKFTTTSSPLTLDSTHNANIVQLTGSTARTFSFTAAATLTNGWWCIIENSSTADLTVDPNSSELIDGLSTYIMYPGEVRMVQCTGSAFNSVVLNGFTRIYNSSGTLQIPPGYTSLIFDMISGGGAGACRTTTGNSGGGGGGAYETLHVPTTSLVAAGSTETITVAGTAAGVTGNSAGTAGNNTSVTVNGTTFTVNGATGGATAATNSAAAGGTFPATAFNITNNTFGITETASTGGDVTSGNAPEQGGSINALHGGGGGGASSSTAGGVRTAGTSLLGGAGGVGGATAGGAPGNGTQPGGGGGGANNNTTSGSGAAGRVIIRGIV